MPRHKDLKRRVRRRMQKTGEAYTAARAHVLKKKEPSAPADYAQLAGMSDAAVKKATGCTWERWVTSLDRAKAHAMPHREIAKLVKDRYRVSPWWAQTVTVGYERIRGLRAIGQRRTGEFEANKSKTYAVPVSRLYRAFSNKRTRLRWLPGVDLTIRTSTRDKSMRITWPDGTDVYVSFAAKGTVRSRVTIQHGKLTTRDAVERAKRHWTEHLSILGELLTG